MQKLLRLLDTRLKYFVAFLILLVPLYPKFPFLRVPGIYVSVRLEDFVVLALVLILALVGTRFLVRNFGGVEKSMMVYLAVGLVSLISGIMVTQTVDLGISLLHWARRIEYLLPFFFGVYVLRRRDAKLLEFYVKLLMIVVLVDFLYGVGQRYFSFPIIITQNQEYSKGIALRYTSGSHINASFAGHYDLATYMLMVLPIIISYFFNVKDRLLKVVSGSSVLAGLWLLVAAVSRISIVSYLVSVVVALVFMKKYKALAVTIVVSLVFFATSPNLQARYGRVIKVGADKLHRIIKIKTPEVMALEVIAPERRKSTPTPPPAGVSVFEDRSTSIRLNVEWPRAIRALFKNPLVGTGFSSITLATDNDYLRLLGEVGILGFSAFFLIIINIAKLFYKHFPLTKHFSGIELVYLSGFAGGAVGVLLNAMFIDVFEASKVATIFWLLAGFAVALLRYNTSGGNVEKVN